MCRRGLRRVLVLSVVCFIVVVKGLQNAASFKSSPAAVAIQDGNTVKQVLQNRSTRGKPSLLNQDKAKTAQKNGGKKSKKKIGKLPRGINLPYSLTIKALRVYYENHSNLILPRRYIISKNNNYPKELVGIDLAATVYDMKWWQRHVKQRPERVQELNELGFVWERLQPEWNLVLEGLVTYRTMHDNLLVPSNFVVPYEEDWPKATWGLALGRSVYRIRNRGDFLGGSNAWSRRDQLESIGFVWDTREYKFDIFCDALRCYSKIETRGNTMETGGTIKVPSQFVVPENDQRWPEHLWGYKLGTKCTAVRQKQLYVKGHPERLNTLVSLGFYSGGNDSLSWLKVVHAAAIYSQMNNRKLDVPSNFVVPASPKYGPEDAESLQPSIIGSDEAWPWPEYLWNYPLGQRLKDIRLKGYFLRGHAANVRRGQLDALGMNWEPKRGRPKKSS